MKFEKHTFSFPDGTRHTIDNAAFSWRLEGSDIAQQVSTFVDQILETGVTELSKSVETQEGRLNIKAGDMDKARKLRNQLLDIVFLQAEESDDAKKEALRKKIHPLMEKIVVLYQSILYEHCSSEIERIQELKDTLFTTAETRELSESDMDHLLHRIEKVESLAWGTKEGPSQDTLLAKCKALKGSHTSLVNYNSTFRNRQSRHDM